MVAEATRIGLEPVQKPGRSKQDYATPIAFVSGVTARDQDVPMAEALCAKHSGIAREALGFVVEHLNAGAPS